MPTCFGSTSLPRQQIIERANAVPGSPGAEKLADQELLIAREQMLADADAVPRLQVLIDILQPLALADRIEDQHRHSRGGPAPARSFDRRRSPCRSPSGRSYPRRPAAAACGSLGMYRFAVTGKFGRLSKMTFSMLIGVALDDAGDAGVERRPLRLRAETTRESAPAPSGRRLRRPAFVFRPASRSLILSSASGPDRQTIPEPSARSGSAARGWPRRLFPGRESMRRCRSERRETRLRAAASRGPAEKRAAREMMDQGASSEG